MTLHRRIFVAGLVVSFLHLPLFSPSAFAQASPPHRLTAADVLNAGEAVTSFDELRELLPPGTQVVVHDTTGAQRRGDLVTIGDSHVVLARPVNAGTGEALLPLAVPFWWPLADVGVAMKRSLFPSANRTWRESSVLRVDVVDPVTDGTLKGFAAGVGVAGAVYLFERRAPDGDMKGLLTFLAVVWGIPVSMRIGHVIDRSVNQPVYRRGGHSAAHVAVIPLAASGRKGAAVSVRFGSR